MRKIGDAIVVFATTTIQELPDSVSYSNPSTAETAPLGGFQPLGEILAADLLLVQ
jgi:hypothetical protein